MTEPPHDILAAEAFVVPAGDPELHPHGPLKLPDDPTGIVEPHDVLAAEEFAMPAPRPGGGRLPRARQRAGQQKGRLALLAAALVAIAMLIGALRRLNRAI
jgi:hypothetical protein